MSESTASLSAEQSSDNAYPLRFITAASLFDGHDAAINIMRRIMQEQGAEIIHLGHNLSVDEIVRAALQEDADGIAVSSYQGGHVEYFKYMIDQLRANNAEHIRVFGGGGGTIAPDEIKELVEYGMDRIYSPNDGLNLGLENMIGDMLDRTRATLRPQRMQAAPVPDEQYQIGRMLTFLERNQNDEGLMTSLRESWAGQGDKTPVIGITGTGGAGKSSLTDELLNRFLTYLPNKRIAVLAVDPSRRRTGGALLGDRIRVNSLTDERVFLRSMATRRQHLATSAVLQDCVQFLKTVGFDLVVVETAGIGQSDTEIVDLVDFSCYVMTSDYGAATQLEKIDMIDYADVVALNKFEKRGSEDALRDIRKQWMRNHKTFTIEENDIPVYPTIASQFNDPGINRLFANICQRMVAKLELDSSDWTPDIAVTNETPKAQALIPGARVRYLAEIAEHGRSVNDSAEAQADAASNARSFYQSLKALGDAELPASFETYTSQQLADESLKPGIVELRQAYQSALNKLSAESLNLLREWPARRQGVIDPQYVYEVRGKEIRGDNYTTSLSHLQIPKVAAPNYRDWGDQLRYLMKENLPGSYPYTAGVFPYRREGEDPTRMFAGEGTPERTNRRFHYLSAGEPAKRLSTAFDSVTLYGENPEIRPDVYGKIGNSGVSIATLDDMKKLYSGFDLCAPATSVSMTINGPASIMLAFFMNAAIDQQVEIHLKESGQWKRVEAKLAKRFPDGDRATYVGKLPDGNDGLGLGLLGITGDQLVDAETYQRIKAATMSKVRGTVQADILKEDQAQNTCIFSTEFAMRMMGDVQASFIDRGVRNYYSVSVSGYHIAEAGANPISQLAFTIANGFTLVEYYLSRGMAIDDFAPNLSFFFSNGMDPEYTVLGRVARRIWARALRERYGASARSQMLKYHIQTSGRSLHAQEIQFNDIRTTVQALGAIFDNCNSLHTNAYDEAVTTPTEESVRRAVAIQLIINRELGINKNENPWQGSYVIDTLTDLVEEAVFEEFERISERGGVLGAMETMYQRGKIQEESLYYEMQKHDGRLPIIGVNTFLPKESDDEELVTVELIRSTEEEKQQQITSVERFMALHASDTAAALDTLKCVARDRENVFEQLMEAVKVSSLGQISHALYQVGGKYRRNM